MTLAAVVGAITQGGTEPVRLSVEAFTAVAGGLAALIAAIGGLWSLRSASKAKVSGDAHKARVQEEEARNNTVAHWQALVEQKDRDLAIERAEHAEEVAELKAQIKAGSDECDAIKAYLRQQETVLLGHVPWDFIVVHAAAEAGLSLPPVPPLRPPGEGI